MTHQTHKVATDALDTLGTHPIPDNSGRDAIHLAVEPVVAGHALFAGQPIKIDEGFAVAVPVQEATGIVDPFLTGRVQSGDKFWLVVFPRKITSLRHVWSHPDFPEDGPAVAPVAANKEASIAWMREWAKKHVSEDYYGDRERVSDDEAYAFAIHAGEKTNIGPYEDARDAIDNEWWGHWEAITGKPGKRGEYFSCSC